MRGVPAALALLLAACGAGTGTPSATGWPRLAGLVLQVRSGGGFVAPAAAFRQLPSVSIYADGLVITPGAVPAIYPGPALPPLLQTRISPAGVARLAAEAEAAGVTDPPPDTGTPPVADAPTTSFVLVTGGVAHRVEVAALGMEDAAPTLSDSQRAARSRLAALERDLTDPAAHLGEPAPPPVAYQPQALSVLAAPAPTSPQPGQPGAGPPVDWPLADLATGGTPFAGQRCLAVAGPDAARLLPLLRSATQLTRWRSGGALWSLSFRPEVPGDPPCSDGG